MLLLVALDVRTVRARDGDLRRRRDGLWRVARPAPHRDSAEPEEATQPGCQDDIMTSAKALPPLAPKVGEAQRRALTEACTELKTALDLNKGSNLAFR